MDSGSMIYALDDTSLSGPDPFGRDLWEELLLADDAFDHPLQQGFCVQKDWYQSSSITVLDVDAMLLKAFKIRRRHVVYGRRGRLCHQLLTWLVLSLSTEIAHLKMDIASTPFPYCPQTTTILPLRAADRRMIAMLMRQMSKIPCNASYLTLKPT